MQREEKQTKNKRPILNLMPPTPVGNILFMANVLEWCKTALHKASTALDAKKKLKTTLYIKKKAANYSLSSFLNKIHQPDHINDKHWLCLMYLSKIKALMMTWGGKFGILGGKEY